MQAAIGLSQHKQARQGVTLSRALDAEADEEVQLAILASLGRIATTEAVQKLIAAAEPEGRLFRKKSAAYRLAAVQALADAGTPEAIAALKALAEDKDRDVRELVGRLLEAK
jgi:HEAT repeat protein